MLSNVGNGGTFYINAKYATLNIVGTTLITDSKALKGFGGLAYVEDI